MKRFATLHGKKFPIAGNNMQPGFIQISILVAIIVGTAVLGGTGYVAYEAGQRFSQNTLRSPTTATDVKATTTVEASVPTQDADSVVDLQKQVSDLTKKINEPKVEQTKSTEIKKTEESETADDTAVFVSTNPSAQCLPTKKDWDAFIVARANYEAKFNSLISTFKSLSSGTTNSPSDSSSYFQYVYNRMTAGKTSFTSQAESVRKAIDTLSKPPTASDADFQKMKDAYGSAISNLQIAFDLSYQGATVVGNNKDGVGTNDLNSALSLYNDAQDAYKKISTDLAAVSSIVSALQKGLGVTQSNGCIYTFGSNDKVWTTTANERAFSQSRPSVTSQGQLNEVVATVSLSTNLPVEISENGTTKTVMYLNCPNNGSVLKVPVQQVSSSVVQALVYKKNLIGDQCVFIYSGNGDDFSSGTIYLPW